MFEKRVVVHRSLDALEAHIVRGRLLDAGIECELGNENVINADWLLSRAIGGVTVNVKPEDESRAREVLEAALVPGDEADEPEEAEAEAPTDSPPAAVVRCPHCHSDDVFNRHWLVRGLLSPLLIFAPIFGLTLLQYLRPWHCRACLHAWTS